MHTLCTSAVCPFCVVISDAIPSVSQDFSAPRAQIAVSTARQRSDRVHRHEGAALSTSDTAACTITRFQLTSAFWLPFFAFAFRRVRKEARTKISGLLASAFLIEGPRVCYTLSIWENERAITDFGTLVKSHLAIARWSLGRTFSRRRQRPLIWSTKWRLVSLSTNMQWNDVDWSSMLAQQAVKFNGTQQEKTSGGRG